MKPGPRYIVGAVLMLGTFVPSASAGTLPWFDEMTGPDPLAPQACSGTGCWTNYLRVTDIDGNGTLDLVVVNYQGFFLPGTAEPLIIYENDGSAGFTNVSDTAVDGFTGRIRQVAIGDVDGDGDPDLYVPSAQADGDAFFINDGVGVFTDEVADRLPGLSSRAGAARFFDADADGDLDLFLADGFIAASTVAAHLYVNDGDGNFSEQAGAFPTELGGDDIDDVDIFDADRDFDLDVLVNVHDGANSLWLNDGAGTFSDASDDLPAGSGGLHYNPAVCDVDNDGDLDIWVDNIGGGYGELLLINEDGVFTNETSTRVTGNTGDDDNGIVCADVDGDGDFDAVVLSLSSGERFLQNDGDGNFAVMGGVFPDRVDSTLWGEFGDLDGDGRFDLVTGQGEGDPSDDGERIDLANVAVAVDDRPPVIIAVEVFDDVVAPETDLPIRFAVSDRSVTDEGPRLSAAFARLTVDGNAQTVDAVFSGGDVFRVVVPGQPEGTVGSLELCATDRADNETCSDLGMLYVQDEGPGTSGGTDDPSASGTDSASASGSTAGSGDTASASGSGASAGSDSAGTEGATETDGASQSGDSESGCSCRTRPGGLGFVGWLVVLGLLRRRRG